MTSKEKVSGEWTTPPKDVSFNNTGSFLSYFAIGLAAIGFPLIALGHIDYCAISDTETIAAVDRIDNCLNISFFERLAASTPNEIGDTLAGIFGSLAFLVATIAIVLQSYELSEQRKEFAQQRQATQDMAKSMEKQAKIFEDERLARQENRAEKTLEELHRSLLKASIEVQSGLTGAGTRWEYRTIRQGRVVFASEDLFHVLDTKPNYDTLHKYYRSIIDLVYELSIAISTNDVVQFPEKPLHFGSVVSIFEKIDQLVPELSLALQTRLEEFGFPFALKSVISLSDDERYWQN